LDENETKIATVGNRRDSILTLKEAQQEVADYLEAKGEKWSHAHDPYFRVTKLIEEVGELARAVINMESNVEEQNRRGSTAPREKKLEMVKDGLGDILYNLLGIGSAYGIQLDEAFRDSMKIIKTRYPVEAR
jgi:NTP pyrophosphatase (non-canonical NTP hydrolase)